MLNNSNGMCRSGSPYMFIFDDILTIWTLEQRSNEILTFHFCECAFLNHSKTEFNTLVAVLFSADRLLSGTSWYCLFRQYYRDLGRYIKHYPVLKRAWEQLKNFLQQRCPRMIASLKGACYKCFNLVISQCKSIQTSGALGCLSCDNDYDHYLFVSTLSLGCKWTLTEYQVRVQ